VAGITSFGAYVPYLRLPLAAIGGGKAADGGPEKAVASWDEDSVTMAVSAAVDCLAGRDRASVDAVLFASTTYPLKEKQAAAIIAKALDLRRDVMTVDVGDSLRAGTNVLRMGLDAIKAGSAKSVLVVASDVRMAAPRSPMESKLGDAAAAFLLGDDEVAAEVVAGHAIADEIIDVWRTEGDPFVHTWEDRFVVDHGYRHNVKEVVKGLFDKQALSPKDVTKVVLYGPDARSHSMLVRELGLDSNQVQDSLFGKVGNAGAAFVPLQLVAALAEAKSGDRLLIVAYGDGAEAFIVDVKPEIEELRDRRGVRWHLQRRGQLASYDKYLRFRQMLVTERDRRGGGGISATKHFRDRDDDVTLLGLRCRRCSTVQYPSQRVCYCCFAKDEFDKVRLSDQIGKVMSFTFDNFAGSPDPPLVATVTDVLGARLYLQMTDASPKEVKLDLPVELVFRRMHEAGGTPNYYWKITPVRGDGREGD
jgi:hydroxymethylglutaryl-CoA synthase